MTLWEAASTPESATMGTGPPSDRDLEFTHADGGTENDRERSRS